MIIFSALTAILWIFFVFYQLNGISKISGLLLFGLNLIYGLLVLLLLDYVKSNIAYLILGGILLIAGLRYLAILNKGLFYWAKTKWSGQNLFIEQLALFTCWLGFVSQSNVDLLKEIEVLLIFDFVLAGLLQLIMIKATQLKVLGWQKELIIALTGLFIVINSLIIMSGDVSFFLHILEKILHIN